MHLIVNVEASCYLLTSIVALIGSDLFQLLVNNKIISLDLPVADVYKKIWCAKGEVNIFIKKYSNCMITHRCTSYLDVYCRRNKKVVNDTKLAGHVARMNISRWANRMHEWMLGGFKRARGRRKAKQRDRIVEYCEYRIL